MIMIKNRLQTIGLGRRNKDPIGSSLCNSSGGEPLEPIYENDHIDVGRQHTHCNIDATQSPMREYMSQTLLDHARNFKNSNDSGGNKLKQQFQIVNDNASSHPDIIDRRNTNKLNNIFPSSPAKGRWGSGESSSSIHTDSTSSLTLSFRDGENDDQSMRTFINSKEEQTLTSREIIDQASDVVAGKYDYGTTTSNTTFPSINSVVEGRRQMRRNSLPSMPTRTSSGCFDVPPLPPKPCSSKSLSVNPSDPVKLDKFGIPIHSDISQNTSSGRSRRGRRSSMGDITTSHKIDMNSTSPRSRRSKRSSKEDFKSNSPKLTETSSHSTSSKSRRTKRSSKEDSKSMDTSSHSTSSKSQRSKRSSKEDSKSKASKLMDTSSHSTSSKSRRTKRSSKEDSKSMDTSSHSTSSKSRRSKRSSKEDSKPKSFKSKSVTVDKFGIPIMENSLHNKSPGSPGKSRRGRRSSMGDSPSKSSKSKSVTVDKFGIPIMENSLHNKSPGSPGKSRRGRRSSMGDSSSKSTKSKLMTVDKFGIPIMDNSSHNKSPGSPGSPVKSRRGRRSSMGDSPSKSPKSKSVSLYDKFWFGVPIPDTSSHSKSSGRSRRGRRSSMGDSTSVPAEPSAVVVDKFGIPIPDTSSHSKSSHGSSTRRTRRGRRSSMGDLPSVPREFSSVLVDKYGVPIKSALSSVSTYNDNTKHRRQGRRSSMPNKAVSFDLPSPSSKSITSNSTRSTSFHSGSVPVDRYGIPMWPTGMNSNTSSTGRRRQGRRSSMPTTPTCTDDFFNTSSNSSAASAMRFFPDELQLQGRTISANAKGDPLNESTSSIGAPIQPMRSPSDKSLGSNHSRASSTASSEQLQNASFNARQSQKKTTSDVKTLDTIFDSMESETCAPMRPKRVLSGSSELNACTNKKNVSLDKVLGVSNSKWGKTKFKDPVPSSDESFAMNTVQQKEKEWSWW